MISAIFAAVVAALFASVPVFAAVPLDLPAIPIVKPAPRTGKAPASTVFPAHILNQFRRSPLLLWLGHQQFHLSLQPSRAGGWQLVLLQKGGNVHQPAAALSLNGLEAGKTLSLAADENYSVRLIRRGGEDVLRFERTGGTFAPDTVPLDAIKLADYEGGIPVPSLGGDWRLIYEREMWPAAGRVSIVFLKKTGGSIEFHLVPADAVTRERPHVADLGSVRVALTTDGQGNFVVRTLP